MLTLLHCLKKAHIFEKNLKETILSLSCSPFTQLAAAATSELLYIRQHVESFFVLQWIMPHHNVICSSSSGIKKSEYISPSPSVSPSPHCADSGVGRIVVLASVCSADTASWLSGKFQPAETENARMLFKNTAPIALTNAELALFFFFFCSIRCYVYPTSEPGLKTYVPYVFCVLRSQCRVYIFFEVPLINIFWWD